MYIPCRKIESLYQKNRCLKKIARGLSVATTYLLVFIIILLLIKTILPTLSESVLDLAEHIPLYYDEAIKYIESLPEDGVINGEMILEPIEQLSEIDITQFFSPENIIKYVQRVIGIASGLFSIFVTVIVSIYILLERADIVKFIQRLNSSLFSEEKCKEINKYFMKGNEIFFKYISSQVADGILVGIVMAIALLIMKVKYAVLLGLFIGIFNLIPYFGAIIAVALTAIITIFTGGITQAIWVVIVLVILQQIDANIINPKIVGDALEMSKILIIFAVTVGGAYFGVLGMFLGVPVVAVIKMILDDYIDKNEKKPVNT